MKLIRTGSIAIGDAKREGRVPSHDGEYLTVYYVPGDPEANYIVEDNAGVAWTSAGEGDALNDCDQDFRSEVEEQIAEARSILKCDRGVPARSMGSEARGIAIGWGWATEDDFDGGYIIYPYRGWAVQTGFLGGNLFAEDPAMHGIDRNASIVRYAELCREALRREFPGAEVEVGYEINAEGSLPAGLQTKIALPADLRAPSAIRRAVSALTAPCSPITASGTPSRDVLAALL